MRFNERFDAYFLENIKTRDALSISLMPSVTKYSLTRKMLEDIYKQSDNPLYKNLETQGAIYADGLGVKDGTIHFFEQSIPKFHELSVSGGTVQYNASS